MTSYIITEEMIQDLFDRIENTPPDMSPEIKVGDWVQLDTAEYVPAWASGHVTAITESGLFIAYGGRTEPACFRLHGWGMPVPARFVTEHWREIEKIVRQDIALENGGTLHVEGMEPEWVRIR